MAYTSVDASFGARKSPDVDNPGKGLSGDPLGGADGAGTGGPAPDLMRGHNCPPGWTVKVWPLAGEATIVGTTTDPSSYEDRPAPLVPHDRAHDFTDQADNRARVARRARQVARRYAVSNGCERLWTLTYRNGRPCTACNSTRPLYACRPCRNRVRSDVRRFWFRLRARKGRTAAMPYVYTLEEHKDGHVHVHVATTLHSPGERVHRAVAGLWGHGFVDEARPRGGRRARARKAAGYAIKYATKAIEAGVLDPGEHAYEVGQGYQAPVLVLPLATREAGIAAAIRAMWDEEPAYRWESEPGEDWRGPPVVFLSWD